jgi:HEAT repeat protein
LFRAEKDRELRTELINALIDISGCKDEKLSLLRLGIATDQAGDTREAAIDGLIDLEDERALPLLQELTADPDEKVRAVAKHALALATELLKAR